MKADIHIILDDAGNAPILENIDKNSNDAGETKVKECDFTN